MPLQVTTFVQLLPDLARTVHALASAATEIYIAEGGRGDSNFLVEEFEAQGFSVTRLDLPPELAAGRCGVYHMRKREEASGPGGTGGAGEDAGGVGGEGGGGGGGEGGGGGRGEGIGSSPLGRGHRTSSRCCLYAHTHTHSESSPHQQPLPLE